MEQKISIAWIDLSLTVKNIFCRNEKIILNRVNGCVHFGSLNALMGPSGAGKTSLLKCINGKINSGIGKDSKIFLSSEKKIKACFIGQHNREHLIMGLTAQQNMIYASKLKNSANNTKIDHKKNVSDILSQLMISDIADTKVMNCSGGEQKRLSIALELTSIIKPNLICIDEPTTGLDSNAAEIVMKCLKILCESHNISIITSIHQPNSDILMMFDKLYVLAKGGICVYSGPPQELSTHLTECGVICNEFQVPIELLLKVSSKFENNEKVLKLCDKTSREKHKILNKCVKETKLYKNGLVFKSKTFKPIDFWYLLLRGMTYTYISQWKALLTQILFLILFSIFTTYMYNSEIGKPDGCFSFLLDLNTSCVKQLEDDTLLDQNVKFMYSVIVTLMFIQITITAITFVSEIKIFVNEHQNRWYSTGSYYLAKTIVELIPIILYSNCLGFLSYYISGQIWEIERVLYYMLIVCISMICVQGVAFLSGTIFINNDVLAILAAIILNANLIMFANYLILIKDMPPIFQIISNISYQKLAFNSGLIIVYGFNRCSEEQTSIVLHKFGLSDELFWINVKQFVLLAISLRFMAFIVLYFQINTFFKRNKSKFLEYSETDNQSSNRETETVLTIGNHYLRKGSVFVISSNVESDSENDSIVELEPNENINKELSIAWIDLTLISPKNMFSNEKIIINNICGFVEFGSLNALMGPSGAGKTSLLKCINGTNTAQLSDKTMIYLSNSDKIHTCFITQDTSDHLINGLTAKQSFIYASKLKNSDKDVNHENIVKNLMNELLIGDICDTNVENCSGGEQKRIVLGMELTSHIMPNLICIDEPTSGLDSNAAEVVIKCLKQLSQNHKISIITSIHQPNNDILMMFDKLYVLSKGGICVYSGPPQQLNTHLSGCGIICNEFQTPIEVLLKYSSIGIEDKHVLNLANKTSLEKDVILIRCKDETVLFPDGIQNKSKRFKLIDLWILLLRTMTYTYRYFWKFLLMQFLLYIGFGYFLILFFDKEMSKPSGCISFEDDFENCNKTTEKLKEESLLQQNIKYSLMATLMIVMFQFISTTISFTYEMKVFLNEHRNGWYSSGAYYWGKAIIELVPTLITIYCYIYVIDIYDEKHIFYGYLFFITISVLSVQSVGHITGIIFSDNVKTALLYTIGVGIILFLFCNFFIPIKELHYSLQYISDFVIFKLSLENIIILFYGFNRCADNEFSSVLYLFGIDDNDFYKNTRNLIIIFIFLRTFTLIALLIKVNPITNSKKGAKLRESAIKSLKPFNAYIPGLTSNYRHDMKSIYTNQ